MLKSENKTAGTDRGTVCFLVSMLLVMLAGCNKSDVKTATIGSVHVTLSRMTEEGYDGNALATKRARSLDDLKQQLTELDWDGKEWSPTFTFVPQIENPMFKKFVVGRPVRGPDVSYVIWSGRLDGEPFAASYREVRDVDHAFELLSLFYERDSRLASAVKWIDIHDQPVFHKTSTGTENLRSIDSSKE